MGLSSALATAMSGLRANQAALSIVSGNIANAQTPGYVTQTPNQIEVATGTTGTGSSSVTSNSRINMASTSVASATRDGHRVYVSLLGSHNLGGDCTALFDWVWRDFVW